MLDELRKRSELLRVHQLELVDEVDEVLEAGIEVRLRREQHDVLEVGMVDVCIHSEEPLEDYLYDVHEVLGEGNS